MARAEIPPTMDSFQASLVDTQRQLAALEGPYLRAKEYLKSDQYGDDLQSTIAKIRKLVPSQRAWTGDAALLAVGAVMQVLEDFTSKIDVIVKYDSLKESMRRYTTGG